MINYGRQDISEEDILNVVGVLKSPFLTQGPTIREFEKSLEEYTGAKYCIAMANGTAALHIAVLAAKRYRRDVNDESEGITSPNTFVATSNALVYSGIKPVFCDIDPVSYNLDPNEVELSITPRTKFLLPVHFAGLPADMTRFGKLAKKHNLTVIEDAAHAIGSTYPNGDRVGSCLHSDMTIFSFHPVKTITTGEGGAITTNSDELAQIIRDLVTHGITKDPNRMSAIDGPWYYEMQSLGYNYRLTELQAALGVSQMKRLNDFKRRRRSIVDKYNDEFSKLAPIQVPFEPDNYMSCYHLYVARFDFESMETTRNVFMSELVKRGVGTQVHYIPVYRQPFYIDLLGYKKEQFPQMEKYYRQALSLPLYPAMSDEDVNTVINAVKDLI